MINRRCGCVVNVFKGTDVELKQSSVKLENVTSSRSDIDRCLTFAFRAELCYDFL